MAGLMLPEGVAYAGIAGLAPGRALAAAAAGGVVYAALGRSRFAVISPTSSSAAILAAAVASLGAGAGEPARAVMAAGLTGMAGLLFLVLAAARMGSLAAFVSRPVLRGFAFGLALTIILHQLPHLLGIAGVAVLGEVARWHLPSLLLGSGSLALLLALRRLPRLPGALLVLALGIALGASGWPAHWGVALTGRVALIVPVPQIPPLSQLPRMAQLAAPIALILFAESWGTMRSLALAAGDEIAASRELMALGAANAAAALVQGIPVGAGFSAGSANAAAGATSRLSALVGALALIAFAGLGSRWLALIPEPMLAAVVIAALTHALDPKPILRLLGLGRDLWIALAALAGVLLLGVVGGMLAAIALSLAVLIYEFAHPRLSELGQVANGHDFVDIARHPEAQALPGVIVLRPNAPLFFANAEAALDAVALRAAGRGIALVVLSLEESNDLDSTALDALAEFARRLDARGQRLRLARVHDRVRELLEKAQLAQLAAGSTYSVADAAVT